MRSVIMIDDDKSILDIFRLIFERAGYSVTAFTSPDVVLENKFEEPDIFIIDKQLSGADGADVCRFLKQRTENSRTPVIIFSAGTQIDLYAKKAGADGFLEKPFKTKQLLAMVESLVTGSST